MLARDASMRLLDALFPKKIGLIFSVKPLMERSGCPQSENLQIFHVAKMSRFTARVSYPSSCYVLRS